MRWLVLAGICAACAGPVVSRVQVIPPAPTPTPVEAESPAEESEPANPDSDGDGVLGADDRCPDLPETVNQFEDEDGCADEPPPAHLRGDEIVFEDAIAFGPGGRLSSESDVVIDAIAEVLKDQPELELVEIGAHFRGQGSANAREVSRLRAVEVVGALAARGVEKTRLRAAGYGDRCTGSTGKRPAIEVKVVARGGKETGVTLGCSP